RPGASVARRPGPGARAARRPGSRTPAARRRPGAAARRGRGAARRGRPAAGTGPGTGRTVPAARRAPARRTAAPWPASTGRGATPGAPAAQAGRGNVRSIVLLGEGVEAGGAPTVGPTRLHIPRRDRSPSAPAVGRTPHDEPGHQP